jgi:hypothetical protein
MSLPFNIYYNNTTNRIVIKKNNQCNERNHPNYNFEQKMKNLSKSSFNNFSNVPYEPLRSSLSNEPLRSSLSNEPLRSSLSNEPLRSSLSNEPLRSSLSNELKIKKSIIYGIKKKILPEFSQCNDLKLELNNNNIFDCFYLFPNISETNIINEKKINIFHNINERYDFQYFPIDYVACGISIPLKNNTESYSKIKIKNIFWNIFQSLNTDNELYGIIPNKNDYIYKKIKFQVNFELHSQIPFEKMKLFDNKILPYMDITNKNITPSNTCLYKILSFEINTKDGSNFNEYEINFIKELDIQCALLCIKITINDQTINILKGLNKFGKLLYGHIPFSQFILNFDYEII